MKILRSFSRVAAFAIVLGVSGLSAMQDGDDNLGKVALAMRLLKAYPTAGAAILVPATLGGLVLVQKGGEWVWVHVTAEKPSMTKNVIKAGSTGLIYAAMNQRKSSFGAAAAAGSHFVVNAIGDSSIVASITGSASAFVDAYIGDIGLVKTVKSYVSPYSALGKYIAYVGVGMVVGRCIDKKMKNWIEQSYYSPDDYDY